MNLLEREEAVAVARVPRTRGDEPTKHRVASAIRLEFPAHAGMNRSRPSRPSARAGVPRTRGDEPRKRAVDYAHQASSPHTRG